MKRTALVLTLGLLALFVPSAAADAQTIPSPYRYVERAQSLALFGGYLFTDRGESGLGPASAPHISLEYAGRFAGPLSGIVEVGVLPSERAVFARTASTPADAPPSEIGQADALVLLAQAGLRLSITGPRTWNGIAPFVGATGGLVSTVSDRGEAEAALPDNQRVDLGPAFAVAVHAGTDWFLSERVSARLTVRDQLWRLVQPSALAVTGREQREWANNIGVSLGAAFYF